MANWKNLHFFDKNGKAYNFSYDSTNDKSVVVYRDGGNFSLI